MIGTRATLSRLAASRANAATAPVLPGKRAMVSPQSLKVVATSGAWRLSATTRRRASCAGAAMFRMSNMRGIMVLRSGGPRRPVQAAAPSPPPIPADTIAALRPFSLPPGVVSLPTPQSDCLDEAASRSPKGGALARLLHAFKAQGIGPNRKAASASLLLRIRGAGGFAVGADLSCRRVPMPHAYAVSFSPTLPLQVICVRDVRFTGAHDDPLVGAFRWIGSADTAGPPNLPVKGLIAFRDPFGATQQAWSGYSGHPLWATSSWAEEFTNIARQIGDEPPGGREAKALLDLVPELQRAGTALYAVRRGGNARTGQRRSARCLYFKSSAHDFCASCPIVHESGRLERRRFVVANQPTAERRPS
jgi:hypothetical protein